MTLQDGQHRLTAIVETNQAQLMYVAVGMDPDSFDVIDTGRTRCYGDAGAMGHHDTNVLGSTLRMCYAYINHAASNRKVSNASILTLINEDLEGFDNDALGPTGG
jgi:hypothetical protein